MEVQSMKKRLHKKVFAFVLAFVMVVSNLAGFSGLLTASAQIGQTDFAESGSLDFVFGKNRGGGG